MTRKKGAPPEAEDDGSKEIATIYGDLVTFLMALFILLFVLSYNKEQDETFFTKMQLQFGGEDVEQTDKITSEALFMSKLQGYIEQEKLEAVAQVVVDEQKIKLSLYPPVLFDSGKATLKKRGKMVLKGFGAIIKEVRNPIIIEGHTDTVPIHNKEFKSNWELSFYRAFSVVKYFMWQYNFSPKQLSAMGYGEYHPVALNDSKEGRARNRRIEINIIRIGKAAVATTK